MRCYLMQHGDSLPKDVDPERPLSDEGTAAVQRMGRFLALTGTTLSFALHSGKTRARQTAEIIAAQVGLSPAVEETSDVNPLDDPTLFAERLEQEGKDLLVASHMPFVAKLTAYLVTGRAEPSIASFVPGALVCLDRRDDGTWQIAWTLPPELLPNE